MKRPRTAKGFPWLPWVLAAGSFAAGSLVAWTILTRPTASDGQPAEHHAITVVNAMRELATLTSSEFHLERVVDLRDKQNGPLGMFPTEDAILFVAVGRVQAGVDLHHLSPDDMHQDPEKQSLTVTLPRAQITSVTLDNHLSFVHSRHTGMFAKRRPDLESLARQRAEDHLREAALERNILTHAETSAHKSITELLKVLGFKRVTVTFHDKG